MNRVSSAVVHFRYGCSVEETPAGGDRHRHAVIDDGLFSITPAANQAKHPVADAKTLGHSASGLNLSGELEPEDIRFTERRRILSASLQCIGTVEGRG